jgi:hypothetical protein
MAQRKNKTIETEQLPTFAQIRRAANAEIFGSFDQQLYKATTMSHSECAMTWVSELQREIECTKKPKEMFEGVLPLVWAPRVVGDYTPRPQPVTCSALVDTMKRYTVFRMAEDGTHFGFASFDVHMDAERGYATDIVLDRLFVGRYNEDEEFQIMPPAYCLECEVVVDPSQLEQHICIRYDIDGLQEVRRQILLSPLLVDASEDAREFIDWLCLVVADPEYYRVASLISDTH